MIVVHAIVRSRPEHRAETAAALAAMVRDTTAYDDGCLSYAYAQSLTDPDEFICAEEWRDRDALRGHLASTHLATLDAVLERTAAGPATIRIFEASPTEL